MPAAFRHSFARLVLPAALALGLFIAVTFLVIIPGLEEILMQRKRELIQEITHSAHSQLVHYHQEAIDGRLSRTQAQQQAMAALRDFRYGPSGKDYVWITDTEPTMLMHPYRSELEGSDLSEHRDPDGKPLFLDHVRAVADTGQAFVSYRWQWMDDAERIVPKISHVRSFRPWGWIVGTGVYLEDVQVEIRQVSRRLAWISAGITAVIALLLAVNLIQALRSETRRRRAEQALARSRERYRTLVEASREGVVMALEGRISNANRTACQLLGDPPDGWYGHALDDLLPAEGSAREISRRAAAGDGGGDPVEADLIDAAGHRVPVMLGAAPVQVQGQSGLILTFRDLRAQPAAPMPVDSEGLLELAGLGLLRAQARLDGRITAHNRAAAQLLGHNPADSLVGHPIRRLVARRGDLRTLIRGLRAGEPPRNHLLHLATPSGGERPVRCWATVTDAPDGAQLLVLVRGLDEEYGIIDRLEQTLASHIAHGSSMLQAAGAVGGPATAVPMQMPLSEAATHLASAPAGVLLLHGPDDRPVGILRGEGLLEAVLIHGRDLQRPAYEAMQAPIRSLPAAVPLAQAIDHMHHHQIDVLPLTAPNGRVSGMLSWPLVVPVLRWSFDALAGDIQRATDGGALADYRARIPVLQRAALRAGLAATSIMRLGTALYDRVLGQIIARDLAEHGPAPRAFAWLVIGSQGRHEQTLLTDQDSALLIGDDESRDDAADREWFLDFARRVTVAFRDCGVPLCRGEAMASNPEWCQTLSDWRERFDVWIGHPEPQDLIDVNIFFDFRCCAGDPGLADSLRAHIFERAAGNDIFFYQLAHNIISYKPPLGLFGQLLVSRDQDLGARLDLKEVLLLVVDFARIYALRHRIAAVSTLERLDGLQSAGVLAHDSHADLCRTFALLQDLRIQHQVRCLEDQEPPDNRIDPQGLGEVDTALLKRAFALIGHLQARIAYDFARQA